MKILDDTKKQEFYYHHELYRVVDIHRENELNLMVDKNM